MNKPIPGITTEANIVKIVDADTILVEVTRRFSVRLTDPDNPKNVKWGAEEKNTVLGKEAIEKLSELIQPGDKITLFVPSNNSLNLMDIQTFNRILGEIWVGDINLSKWLEENNLAHKKQHIDGDGVS